MQAQSALASLADIAAQYDADGIDVYFLNSTKEGKGMTVGPRREFKLYTADNLLCRYVAQQASQVQRLFNSVQPCGMTPIGERLDRLLRAYMKRLDAAKANGQEDTIRPVNFIILTDGTASEYLIPHM